MSQMKRGERIRELREIQTYTREAFAEKIDISPKFLYEIETGKKGFSADVLGRISKALSISCDYIMFGEDVKHYGNEKNNLCPWNITTCTGESNAKYYKNVMWYVWYFISLVNKMHD